MFDPENPTYFQVPTRRVGWLRSALAVLNQELIAEELLPLQIREVLSPDLPEGQSEIVLRHEAGLLDFDEGRIVLAALERIVDQQLRPQAN